MSCVRLLNDPGSFADVPGAACVAARPIGFLERSFNDGWSRRRTQMGACVPARLGYCPRDCGTNLDCGRTPNAAGPGSEGRAARARGGGRPARRHVPAHVGTAGGGRLELTRASGSTHRTGSRPRRGTGSRRRTAQGHGRTARSERRRSCQAAARSSSTAATRSGTTVPASRSTRRLGSRSSLAATPPMRSTARARASPSPPSSGTAARP